MAKGVPETHPEERQALNWSPRKNWIEKAGGLPSYINSVAVALVRGGMPRERAIPTAVNVVKKTCATGLWGGRPNAKVSPAIRAAACKAAAEWNAKKGGAKLSACADCAAIDLAGPVTTSGGGGDSMTTNTLLKPARQLKPAHLKRLAKANANLARAGMPKGKRKRVLQVMARQMKQGKALSFSRPVDLAFNPSEMRAPAGAAGGGRWTAGGGSSQQKQQQPNRHDRALAWRVRNASNPTARKQAARALARIARRRAADAKRKAKRKQQQHDALAAVNAQRRANRGVGTNAHMRALALRSKTASNSKARVQAARALARIIRRHGSEKKRANRQAARSAAKQARSAARQSSAASRARAVAAARAARQQQAASKRQTTATARAQRTAAAQRLRQQQAMSRPARIQTGKPRASSGSSRLRSRLF